MKALQRRSFRGVGDMWPGAGRPTATPLALRGVGDMIPISSMARPTNPFRAMNGVGDLWATAPVAVGTQIQGFGCTCNGGMGAIDISNPDTLKTIAIGAALGLAGGFYLFRKHR